MNSQRAAPRLSSVQTIERPADLAPRESRFDLLGVQLSALGFDEAVERLIAAPARGERLRVHFCAVHTMVEAANDAGLRDLLNAADILATDGMPLVWAGRLKGRRLDRVCGPDTMLAALDRGRAAGVRHFFYGGAPGVAQELAATMRAKLPGLDIAGVYTPPFRDLTADEEDEVVRLINESGADFVWVGLGSPKQDRWLESFRPRLDAAVLLAVGYAFDLHAGRVKRAPRWAQHRGLEWIFRLAAEPRRLFGRYTLTSLRFGRLLLADALRRGHAR